jgi:thiol-disulfide isomerase/thioredoxin
MKNKQLLGYVMVGIGFAGLGSLVACEKKADVVQAAPVPPPPAMPAPVVVATPAAPVDPAANLFAQTLNDEAGKPQALSQWKGKPLLVNFWAPWCAPCVKEMPELSTLSGELKAKGIQFIGIGVDTPTNIAEFTGKYKVTYPIYIGGMGATDVARAFGNANGSLPYTVLIGADGKVAKTYLGILHFDELRKDLAAL